MLCAKCHQPLEDDEDYICCAGSELRWRCTECAKVSEGFAFPYGQCPHCGGKLAVLERGPIAEAEALAGIRAAFEIELGGRAFYHRAAGQTDDPLLSELFGKLAEMENEHMATLARRYHVAVPAAGDGFNLDMAALQAGIDGRPDDPATLFKLAIAFERRAVIFFLERSVRAADGSVESQLYHELAAEEEEHAALLATEFERWQAGKPGIL